MALGKGFKILKFHFEKLYFKTFIFNKRRPRPETLV